MRWGAEGIKWGWGRDYGLGLDRDGVGEAAKAGSFLLCDFRELRVVKMESREVWDVHSGCAVAS